jgi:CRP/FNR family transcriptional regulator, cyclic AMP receptor protein
MQPTQIAEFFWRHCADDHGTDALHLPAWSLEDWTALLVHAQVSTLARDDVLMKRGQAEQQLYLLASGALEVNAGVAGLAMGTLFRESPGAVIGEIAFFDGGKRSATVWATEPSLLVALRRRDIEAFAAERCQRGMELLFALGRVLAFRVRRSEQGRQGLPF